MSNSTGVHNGATCLSASTGPSGGLLYTTDPATGIDWCLDFAGGEGSWGPSRCSNQSKSQ